MINEKLGTNYALFNYYGAKDADRVIVAMGSVCDVAEEVIDYLRAQKEKVGLIKVRLYRPWVAKAFLKVLPKSCKKLAVLDRTKEPGALGDPLFLDVATTLREAGLNDIILCGGRYGLGSKDTPPSSMFAVYKELGKAKPKARFTVGITDDVTNLSLPEVKPAPITSAKGTVECKFWGIGGDGTVGANKDSTKIIGDHTDKYIQAYFQYDSKKTGGITISHLRFGDSPIRSPYYINQADLVACHNQSYIEKGYKMVQDVKKGGTFLINCTWDDKELENKLPAAAKKYIYDNKIKVYTVDAVDIATKIGLGKRTSTVLQSAFFKLANVLPIEEAVKYMMQPPAGTGGYPMGGAGGMAAGMGSAQMNQRKEVFCANCAKKYPATSKFCPFCGNPYNPCPVCGSDNLRTAKRCTTCGADLGTAASSGMAAGPVCSRCGAAVQPGVKFCPNCGNKLC